MKTGLGNNRPSRAAGDASMLTALRRNQAIAQNQLTTKGNKNTSYTFFYPTVIGRELSQSTNQALTYANNVGAPRSSPTGSYIFDFSVPDLIPFPGILVKFSSVPIQSNTFTVGLTGLPSVLDDMWYGWEVFFQDENFVDTYGGSASLLYQGQPTGFPLDVQNGGVLFLIEMGIPRSIFQDLSIQLSCNYDGNGPIIAGSAVGYVVPPP